MVLKDVSTLDAAKVKSTLDTLVGQGMTQAEAQAKVTSTLGDRGFDVSQKAPITPVQDVAPETPVVPTVTPATAPQTGVDVPVTPPLKTPEVPTPPKQTNITITPTKTPEAPIEPQPTDLKQIQTVDDWKTQTGGGMNNLESWVESRYGTTASQKDGVLTANIGGIDYQWTIDAAGNPIKTKLGGENAGDIFNQLMAGQELPDTGIKTTPEYSKAKARYDITNKYIGMTEDQLFNAYVNGEIGANLEKDLINNPALAIAKEKYNKKLVTDNINKESLTMLNAYNKANNKDYTPAEIEKTSLEKLSDKFMTMFKNMGKSDTDIASFKDYMASNYPDLVSKTTELNAQNKAIRELADERDARLDEIIKENPGISINRATMLAARQNKDINAQIKSMSYDIANLSADINYQTSIADKEYGNELDRQARQDQLAQEQRGYAFNLLGTAQAQDFAQQQEADRRKYEQDNKGVSTSMIQVGDKQQLINSQTGEVIKEYDVATEAAGTTSDWSKLDDNTLYNQRTGETKSVTPAEASNYTGLDFTSNTDLINKYPNEASFKNNNPTGMTWGISENLKNKFTEAGINYTQGTPRPANEGGAYIKFASVQDGLDAYKIALTEAGSQNIKNRLATWVGTQDTESNNRYANDIMSAAGIPQGATFSDLTEAQTGALMSEQLKRESPNFYKELANIPAPTKPLTDKQFTQSNQIITSFKSDPQVKAFESAYSQGLSLISSLNNDTGAGDMAGVFQFMKTLDPQSVVRESEFELAANTAGVVDKLGNTWDKLQEGSILTDTQARAFKQLAKQFIIDKATIYDTKYSDGIRRLDQQGIDTNVFPASISDQMRATLESDTNTTIDTTKSDEELLKSYFG